jgi:hypothetical protein
LTLSFLESTLAKKQGVGGPVATPVATGGAEHARVMQLSYVAEALRLPSWFDEKRLEA